MGRRRTKNLWEDVDIKAEENTLTTSADTATRKYLQNVELPTPIRKDTVKSTYRNNILQVRLEKLETSQV